MEIPQLLIDLAIMLSTAAIVTIVFKKLRIPSILGYILAGFLIGPHFPMFLTVESMGSIETWSEIGVIVILFHIGLEFDFHKIANIGGTAIISALVKMSGVMLVGYGFGLLLGMRRMDCVFLGAMLSISSTVVIQKCLDELGLAKEKFAGLVMGSLVMEDVLAIFMMVILTTISVSRNTSGSTGIITHLALMICYLIIWLVLGIYIVPSFLNKVMKLMSDETLTLLSLGFCFMMALLANRLGFSKELGAFLAGSFFAGTQYVHEVERVTSGIKDVFGSMFFLSVGMMVDPKVIAEEWISIVPIAIIAVVAKLIFSTIGMVLSGQNLETAIRGGTSLAPIGEFSFIIASLGISLGVINERLYPIIVAASILTIIFTPTLIRETDQFVEAVEKRVPKKLRRILESYTSDDQDSEEHTQGWKLVLTDYAKKVLIYGSIMFVSALAGVRLIEPSLETILDPGASKVITAVFVYAVLIIFAKPFMGSRSVAFTHLWMDKLSNRPPLVVMVMTKIAILMGIAYIPLRSMLNLHYETIFIIVLAGIIAATRLDFISTYYLQLETKFLSNLNQKTMDEKNGEKQSRWLEEDYCIFSWFIPEDAPYIGKTIEDLAWGRNQSVYVVKLRRGTRNITMPAAKTVLQGGDKVYVIGDKQSLQIFHKTLNIGPLTNLRTLKEFLDAAYPDADHALECLALKVRGTENYVGKPIRKSGINAKVHCMILGLERGGYATTMPDANMLIEEGDILWIVGTNDNLSRLAAHSVGEAGRHS